MTDNTTYLSSDATVLSRRLAALDVAPGQPFEFGIENEGEKGFGVYLSTLGPKDADGTRILLPQLLCHISREDLTKLVEAPSPKMPD